MLDDVKLQKFANISAFIIVVTLFMRLYKPAFTVAMIVFALFFIADYYLHRKIREISINTNLKIGMAIFFGSLLLGAVLSFNFSNVRDVWNFITYSLPFFMLTYLGSGYDIKKGLRYALLLIICVGGCLGVYEALVLKHLRINALLQVTTLWGTFMGLVLPVFVYPVFYSKEKKTKYLYACIALVIMLSVYATKTRGVIVPCIICLGILAVYLALKKYKVFSIVVVVIGLLGICVVLGSLYRGYEYQRVYGWTAAIHMWSDNLLLGVGIDNWQKLYTTPQYFPQGATEHLMHAHNLYLNALATTGIIGFSGMMAFFYEVLNGLREKTKAKKVYYYVGIFALSIFLMSALLDSILSIKYFVRIFWMMIFVYYNNIFEDDGEVVETLRQ